ncbi:hypothetical protein EVJ58_g1908 [Rhodofomes roseus]|uniref:Secreted protein n=1 Tax=Rhodofomes roseus TaxID=34475 RepID=A0A4Y9YZI6_9APHY|nr:hypothetical protein EVJ58_g1908 [Rhodofomes roseus]
MLFTQSLLYLIALALVIDDGEHGVIPKQLELGLLHVGVYGPSLLLHIQRDVWRDHPLGLGIRSQRDIHLHIDVDVDAAFF